VRTDDCQARASAAAGALVGITEKDAVSVPLPVVDIQRQVDSATRSGTGCPKRRKAWWHTVSNNKRRRVDQLTGSGFLATRSSGIVYACRGHAFE